MSHPARKRMRQGGNIYLLISICSTCVHIYIYIYIGIHFMCTCTYSLLCYGLQRAATLEHSGPDLSRACCGLTLRADHVHKHVNRAVRKSNTCSEPPICHYWVAMAPVLALNQYMIKIASCFAPLVFRPRHSLAQRKYT